MLIDSISRSFGAVNPEMCYHREMPFPANLAHPVRRALTALQSAGQLGPRRVGYMLLYRLGLQSGHYRRTVNAELAQRLEAGIIRPVWMPMWPMPVRGGFSIADKDRLLAEVEKLLSGRVQLFGALEADLEIGTANRWEDWTAYENGQLPSSGDHHTEDIKLLWEPMRFGWVFPLGRAYALNNDERLPRFFWERVEAFWDANPAYRGPHWASAQEVGLRLIALSFGLDVFHSSPESRPERCLRLLKSLAVHAGRIPATLAYAKAQNNNHLLSEAAALATAGVLLAEHPDSQSWRRLGWQLFNEGLHSQIAAGGSYCQHSTNYHRLMLQLGLWMAHLESLHPAGSSTRLDALSRSRLAAATGWLLALLDPAGGRVPNLGPNDGAYILPLSAGGFEDYRPVLQAAGRRFCGAPPFPAGGWDEMSLWLDAEPTLKAKTAELDANLSRSTLDAPLVIHSPDRDSWAYLRAARFSGRPGHADQLHLDLWQRGVNLTLDPGTYFYNAIPPWDNALTVAAVHNTVTVDGCDQMRRAGRFLYLDWAQGYLFTEGGAAGDASSLSAEHDGYRSLGLRHRRTVRCLDNGVWEVDDFLLALSKQAAIIERTGVLHWLLPDGAWSVEPDSGCGVTFSLDSPNGPMLLELSGSAAGASQPGGSLQLARAGEIVYGGGQVSPTWGWVSPTYAVKRPALALRWSLRGRPDIRFRTRIILSGVQESSKA